MATGMGITMGKENEYSNHLMLSKTSQDKNNRIIKNTLMLYVRMFLIMLVSLYTSRVILQALGIDDYGIYNVVGGLVSAFSILTSSLSSVGARFINFHLGKRDIDKVKKVVSNSINIQIYLSIIILIMCETIGLWFFYHKLNLPIERQQAAFWVYQLSIFTFVVKLLSVPYNALIIAHEKMSAYAYISILEVILQLGLVYCLLITSHDRLVIYVILMFSLSLAITILYYIYCKEKFEAYYYKLGLERSLFKEMVSYAGWNFIGLSSGILKNQGVDIIINIYFGVTINAARGISSQVNNAVTKFSQNFMTALNPQITQSYAAQEWDRFHFLIIQGARFSYYLMLIICLPIFIEMEYILSIWLPTVPPFTCIFAQLQIICSLITVLSNTNITAMLATGKIRNYQIIVGLISLLNLPISLLCLHYGGFATITFYVAIVLEIICLISRLIISKRLTRLSVRIFLNKVIGNVTVVTMFSLIIPIILYINLPKNLISFITIVITSILTTILSIYIVGLDNNEKILISKKFKLLLNK